MTKANLLKRKRHAYIIWTQGKENFVEFQAYVFAMSKKEAFWTYLENNKDDPKVKLPLKIERIY